MGTERVQSQAKYPWMILISALLLVWSFGWVIGPYFIDHIPIYSQIVQVVEEQGINSNAYSYQDSVGSYDGEYFLRDSFVHSGRADYGPTVAFFSGMVLCLMILGFGWRYIL